MKRVPPRVVRRLILAPLVVAFDLLVLLLSPLLLVLGVLLSPLLGGRRPLRLAIIVLAFAFRHLEAVLALFWLWLRSGFGRDIESGDMQARHYDVIRRFVSGVYRPIVHHAHIEVTTDESEEARRLLSTPGQPVVLLSRHAGEGDTLLVIHELLCVHDRPPRVVMHQALQIDPMIDALGARLPNRFVDPRGGDTEVDIAEMAGELDERSALVIFPEGANFSEERRRRGIERLERGGFDEQAEAARAMRNVAAPRPGGALAAIDAAPGADVVVMGHVGFPTSFRDVWRLLPEDQTIEVKLWHEPADAIPDGHEERIQWLFDVWRRLDEWVEDREAARTG